MLSYSHCLIISEPHSGLASIGLETSQTLRTQYPSWLTNLGASFIFRFAWTGDPVDLENAISNKQRAIELTPPGHADLPSWLCNLGISFWFRFNHTQSSEHLDQTISTFCASATQIVGSPFVRLKAAKLWAKLSPSDNPEAFGFAIELLSHVAGLEQTVHKRHSNLIDESNLTASATAAAINVEKLSTALEWLEQGRCLVWNQIQYLRTPVDQLRAYDPALADQFTKVANALEASGSRRQSSDICSEETMSQMIDAQRESQKHVQLTKDWTLLLEKIHALPDFENFLRPPKAASLFSGLPLDAIIIVLNIHEDKCDALALVSGTDTPLHFLLPNFSMQQAVQLRDDLRTYLKWKGMRMRDMDRLSSPAALSKEGIMYKVLRDMWEHLAKPVLDTLGYNLVRCIFHSPIV